MNCSKGEAKRLGLPADLAEQPWQDLDFLGWRDPGAPDRGYMVAEREDGGLVGIALRAVKGLRGASPRAACARCA
ncbi:FBP domain-containing protein [Nonomuraea rubra]|uniref:FBP domain-containing protein n=1 Tax=Nonomuraea rubra TaxID=46180 RepID=UPI00361D6C32